MVDNDISAYTYERTLMMEQRNKLLKEMRLTRRESLHLVQNIIDHHHEGHSADSLKRGKGLETVLEDEPITETNSAEAPSGKQLEQPSSANMPLKDLSAEKFGNLLKVQQPDAVNVRRMHTAVKLNEVITNRSHDAQLVILNLPGPPKQKAGEENYMEFLEVLTEGLEKVLMVRGSGREVITIYS